MNYPPELVAACKEVTEAHPEVSHLFVSLDGRWLFVDDDFNAPDFNITSVHGVRVSLLEDMVDALDRDMTLPAAFYIPGVLK